MIILCACAAFASLRVTAFNLLPRQALKHGTRRTASTEAVVVKEDSGFHPQQLDEVDFDGLATADVTRSDLLEYVGWLRAKVKQLNEALAVRDGGSSMPQINSPRFDFLLAAELAGFAFESYNEPIGARWEEGADGTSVAFKSDAFERDCFAGRLTVTLREADNLPREKLFESITSGFQSGFKPFVMFALVEGDDEDASLSPLGVRGLSRAWDVARSSASPAKDYTVPGDHLGGLVGGETLSRAKWGNTTSVTRHGVGGSSPSPNRLLDNNGDGEIFNLYVKDPSTARLVVSVEEERAFSFSQAKKQAKGAGFKGKHAKEADHSVVVGAVSTPLTDLLVGSNRLVQRAVPSEEASQQANTTSPRRGTGRWPVTWEGWLPLIVAPAEDKMGKISAAAAAGAVVGGPVGALAGAGAMLLWNREVKGRVRLRLSYSPLLPPPPSTFKHSAESSSASSPLSQEPLPRGPKGGTDEVDWHELTKSVGVADRAAALELCSFLDVSGTDTQAALWRDKASKRLVVAFRGTSAPGDLLTDATIVQTPWIAKLNPKEKPRPGEALVHAGFREAADSVSRRLKELMLAACGGEPAEWEVFVTGHSLGGALATLFTADLHASGIDAGRSLPTEAPSKPWWGRLLDYSKNQCSSNGPQPSPPRPKRLACYTFGCPRVGNKAFADLLTNQSLGAVEMYRVVNGADVVARLPRHGNTIGNLLDYEHSGATVLVGCGGDDEPCTVGSALPSKQQEGSNDVARRFSSGCWVEGETDGQPCPLRDSSPLVDPLADGALLFEALKEGLRQGSVMATLDKILSTPPQDLPALVGLDPRFVAAEMSLVAALKDGNAITHHLEPSYYAAMMAAAASSAGEMAPNDGPGSMRWPA